METKDRLVQKNALRVVSIEDLKVDPSYQRPVIAKSVAKIVADLDEVALGIPLVGERDDGSLWIVDGQQRIASLSRLGRTKVRAEVFASQGAEHEAEVFRKINQNRRRLSPLQMFHAMLTAGDEAMWAVNDLAKKHGFFIPRGNHSPSTQPPERLCEIIKCISALVKIYTRSGEDSLRFCLSVVSRIWPNDPIRVKDDIFYGLHRFHQRKEGVVDEDRLVARLATTTPTKLIYSAQLGVGDRANNIADVIEKLYRKRLRNKE